MAHMHCSCLVLAFVFTIAPAVAQAPQKAQSPAIEYVFPAPGCPVKVPTFDSLDAYCRPFDQKTCKADAKCQWTDASDSPGGYVGEASCGAREGQFFVESFDPSDPNPFIVEGGTAPTLPQAVKLASMAYDAAAAKHYDKAILLYTQAMKLAPLEGGYDIGRALVYEYKGNPTRALADYCGGLIKGADWQPQQLARNRIAQLTHQADAKHTPLPIFMRSGVLRLRKAAPPVAPLEIEAPEGADYVLKVINLQDNVEEMLIYVRGGTTFMTRVPLGTYQIRGAFGISWYGDDELFGEDTQYFKLADKDGIDEVLRFELKGHQYTGYRVSLIKQENGNLDTAPIERKEF